MTYILNLKIMVTFEGEILRHLLVLGERADCMSLITVYCDKTLLKVGILNHFAENCGVLLEMLFDLKSKIRR